MVGTMKVLMCDSEAATSAFIRRISEKPIVTGPPEPGKSEVSPETLQIGDVDLQSLHAKVSSVLQDLLGSRHYEGTIFRWGDGPRGYYGTVGQLMASAYEARKLPEANTYVALGKRELSDEDATEIGKLVIEAQQSYGHALSGTATNRWKRDVADYLRKRYTNKDNSGNDEKNRKLREELDDRFKAAHTEIVDRCDDIKLGLDENPIKTLRELRSKTW